MDQTTRLGQTWGEFTGTIQDGPPSSYAEQRIRNLEVQVGHELTSQAKEFLKESYAEQHADLAFSLNLLQGMGAISDVVGETVEKALRTTGLTDKYTARSIHNAIDDALLLTGATQIAKVAAKSTTKQLGKKLKALKVGESQIADTPTAIESSGNQIIPGRVKTRINIRKGDGTNKNSEIETAWRKHGGAGKDNKSQFTISREELISILEDKTTIQAPVRIAPDSGIFAREVETGKIIGNLPKKNGEKPTPTLTILTDKYGNLVNAYPGEFKF
ncbi:hypothetical protein [Candidatus Paracaedibacter symbiosus]|uniref:hypothetical protein n=1 Tax=Candidatus Paracaedibacter symbiosus TaxID=244582 RepID=UPI0006903ACD|nr:hypothetical protein [Candidatus Paracaedibacter symbiosus]